ncbi:4-hydroxyphenylacetate 3-hydroxylase N-terminal domain-containing protein [Streptomyces sp. NPDC006367]|uniref:4-hydroxyphenylacetate 3-hydroxylase N-terminal domain-containing protein n=1 Tax=unclassified Streptomyces TaxID=2593676 RepID=UPI0033A67DAC
MPRTGQDYLASLRDGRAVWLDGELVKDITEHPAFRNTARSIADLYDLAADGPARDVLTVQPGGTEQRILRACHVPRTHLELVERRAAFKTWSEAGYGFLGRSPDCMATGIAGFVSAPEVFADAEFDGRDNLAAYHRRMPEGSLYQAFTVTNPQTDRTKSASGQEEDDLYVRVVKERDDVFVPWENVLTHRNMDAAFQMWWGTPAYTNFVHQASVRYRTKLEFLTGLAVLPAKSNNTYHLPPVQMQLGRLIGWLSIAKSMVLAAETEYEQIGGAGGPVHLSREIASAHRAMAGDLYPEILAELKMLAGGGLIQLPASGYDLNHPELGRLVAKYVRSPGTPAEQRIKLLKLAWDALGSESASRHEQYERFYHGAPHVYLPGILLDGRPDLLEAFTQSCLDGYELGEGPGTGAGFHGGR